LKAIKAGLQFCCYLRRRIAFSGWIEAKFRAGVIVNLFSWFASCTGNPAQDWRKMLRWQSKRIIMPFQGAMMLTRRSLTSQRQSDVWRPRYGRLSPVLSEPPQSAASFLKDEKTLRQSRLAILPHSVIWPMQST
jgi:hypothetical protein